MKNIKSLLFLIIGLFLLLSGILYLVIKQIPPSEIIIKSQSDSPSVISQPAPNDTRTAQGTLVRINNNILSVQISGASVQHFIVSKTFDFQQLVSGTPQRGDAKTVPAAYSDLQTGQQVLVIAEKNSNYARSVYILQ